MRYALALQCSTNWAMKTNKLGAGQFVEFILTREWNESWNERMTWTAEAQFFLNRDMIVAAVLQFKQLQINLKFVFPHFISYSFQYQYKIKRKGYENLNMVRLREMLWSITKFS